MALTDTALRNAKPTTKPYKLYDEGGLFVIVRPSGGKLWRLKYRSHAGEQQLSLGIYPTVGLREARDRRDAAKKLLAAGIDPGAEKKRRAVETAIAADNTFEAIASEFIEKRKKEGIAEATLRKTEWLAGLLNASLGKRPVSVIEPYEILAVLKEVEKKGNHEAAGRMRSFAARVFRYAIVTSRARHNPAADLGGALIAPKVKHHPAIVEPTRVGALLRAIDGYEGHASTRLALQLLLHVFVRPGELRQAEDPQFDLEAAVWRIPAGRMKMRVEHVEPLSRQSVEIIRSAWAVRARGPFLFPSVRTWQRPMSENTLNAALRRLGYTSEEVVAHGFRSTASTLLNESGKWSPDAIERALAHKDKNEVRGTYNRSPYWAERVEMAQWWSDYLDTLRNFKADG